MGTILDHPLISQRYFFPGNDRPTHPRVVRTRDGIDLKCAFLQGRENRTVVHFHGNGETASDWEPILGPFFQECGWSVVFVEYRGYGGSRGTPQLSMMLDDGEDVLRALELSPENVVAMGRSIGSLYAIELAHRLPLAGLILDSGINDLQERILLRVSPEELGTTRETIEQAVAAQFDQSAKLLQFTSPVLILHTRNDELVSLSHAERNASACQQPTLCLFERGGHNAIYPTNRAAYLGAVRDYLSQLQF